MSLEKAEKLELEIEELELADMSAPEIERVVAALSDEGMQLRRARKEVRYKLYRCRTEAEGKCGSGTDEDFKKLFEDQDGFGQWRFFGVTWDVAFDDPYRIVHRDKSEQEEWDELVAAKFPTVLPGGKIVYPDIKVRKRVEEEAQKRGLI
ncbi:MAG: hypothetical protein C0610_09290 [Desulfobacteraceae bacterium]|nr:MAG: hypothetical protein C0610_09290 [Desulfobacteraceae bacterium]